MIRALLVLSLVALPTTTTAEPVDRGGRWQRDTPAEAGFDAARLSRGVESLRGRDGTRALVVARGGRLVVAESWGIALDEPHDVKSASKSVLGLLVGIALERRWLPSLDVRVADVLGERVPEDASAPVGELRLRHLLCMSSGLASTSGEDYGRWVTSDDWTRDALRRPAVGAPGEEFVYSTGNTHVISAMLEAATGRPTEDLAREALLEPIGASVHWWQQSPEGVAFGGNSVSMSALDLARVGHLVAQDGRWGSRQVVPASWIEQSAVVHSEGWPWRYGSYGFLWWHPPGAADTLLAVGYGGQLLAIDRERDLVAVLYSTHEGKGLQWDLEVLSTLRDDVFGAARADAARVEPSSPPPG